MASLRFSHTMLILALSAWLLCLTINLFFPALHYSLTILPSILTTTLKLLSLPLTTLISLLPTTRSDTLAMLCFLLAIACAFIAGSVYGMERQSEYYQLQNLGAENAVDACDRFWDLEKGDLPAYDEKERDCSPYTDTSPSSPTEIEIENEMPKGDAMTGQYYESNTAIDEAAAQKAAHTRLLMHQRFRDSLAYNAPIINKLRAERQSRPYSVQEQDRPECTGDELKAHLTLSFMIHHLHLVRRFFT